MLVNERSNCQGSQCTDVLINRFVTVLELLPKSLHLSFSNNMLGRQKMLSVNSAIPEAIMFQIGFATICMVLEASQEYLGTEVVKSGPL